jgi:hypothetical protein
LVRQTQVRQTQDNGFQVIPVLMPGCQNPPTGFLQLLTWVDLSKAASVLQQPDSLALLRAALRGEAIAAPSIRAEVCPYRGLEPFREEDAPFFCGRDDAIRDLVAKVQAHAFVAIVGASGSGKSSLVFAGLLPALRKESHTRTWDVVSFRPGKSPLRTLAAAFGTAPENAGPAEIDAYLEREAEFYRAGDANTLARIVDRRLDAAPERPDRLLVYVDQWEELYAMAPATEEKEHLRQHTSDVDKFIGLLVASGVRPRATVVFTIRADFYNPLVRNPLISKLLPSQQVNIPLMGLGNLRSAIEMPAKNARLSFSPPELVDEILNDVGSQEGRLPLLQFALKEMWERRKENELTAEAYTAVGGVTGAIEKTAESLYKRLTPAQQDAARRLFLRLVTPGEGQEDTRARSFIPDDPQQRKVINLFSDPKTRLLVTSFAPLQGAAGSDVRAAVEVAHEALIQRWPTLQSWVSGNREKLRARAVILRAMAEWEEHGKSARYLLDPGVQLERGRALVDSPGDVPVDDIRVYVAHSIKKEDDRLAVEREVALADQKRIADAERQAKEAAQQKALTEERARNDTEASARKLRRALVAVAGATVVALVLLGVSLREFYQASQEFKEKQRQLDRANQALAQSINSGLGLDPKTPFTPWQRNALWKLAASGEAVKSAFVLMLAASPEEMARASPGYAQIFRALGLVRPSDAEAVNLVSGVVGGLQTTEGTTNVKFLVAVLRALTPNLSEARGTEALDTLLRKIGQETDPTTLLMLAQALQELPVKLSDSLANEALVPLLRRIGEKTDPEALLTLVQALQTLPGELSDSQANEALQPIMQRIGQKNDSKALEKLAKALEALSEKLSERQVQQALGPALRQIGLTKDAIALQTALALGPKLSEAQANEAAQSLVRRFDQTTEPEALEALTRALRALPADLTEAQTNEALKPILRQFGEARESALQALARALRALAPALTEAQANEVLDAVLKKIGQTEDLDVLQELAAAVEALPVKLTEAQANSALDPVLRQIGQIKHMGQFVLESFPTAALVALAPKLPERQAGEALIAVLNQIGKTTSIFMQEEQLGQLVGTLSAHFTAATAQQAFSVALQQIRQTSDGSKVQVLTVAIQTLATKLTGSQLNEAFIVLLPQFVKTATRALQQIGPLNYSYYYSQMYQAFGPLMKAMVADPFQGLTYTLKTLAPKLSEAQANEVLDAVLTKIGQTEDPDALQVLAEVVQALPVKLTEAQAGNALDPVLRQIDQTINPFAFRPLAHALQALATKLTEGKAHQAWSMAASSLAWATGSDEAAEWARALIALSSSAANRDELLAGAIAYPAAAGTASEVLLEEIRAHHPEAPAKEAGTQAALTWLAAKYSLGLHPPVCPPPPQPYEISRLICPPQGTKSFNGFPQ